MKKKGEYLLLQKIFQVIGLCLVATAFILWSSDTADAMRTGLQLCSNVIIPSLFPFFVLSTLLVELGMSRYLGYLFEPVMRPLFRINGNCACAVALGLIGGYPVGARTAIGLYQNGQCTKVEAERLLSFCNNSGPAFILGVVGTGIFGSQSVGLLLYSTHILASLLVGILFRFYHYRQSCSNRSTASISVQTVHFSSAFTHSVINSITSTLHICGFILCFTVLSRILSLSGALSFLAGILSHIVIPFGYSQADVAQFLVGLLEVSSGVSFLTSCSFSHRLSITAFLLGWAGISVHFQVLSFLEDSGLSLRPYLIGKFLHGCFSVVLLRIMTPLLPDDLSVSFYLAEQTQQIANLSFQQALTISILCTCSVWVIFFLIATALVHKKT